MRLPSRALLLAVAATVPSTPASAAPQMQRWMVGGMAGPGPHPRLTIRPDERAEIQSRLAREPYRTIFERIAAQAARTHDPFDDESGATQQRANTARAAAFLLYLDRTLDAAGEPTAFATPDERRTLGEKAASYLLAMNTTVHVDLTHVATRSPQEVHLWSETLDLLLGADVDVLGENRAAAVQNVADLAADLFGAYDVDLWLGERSTANNHLSKSAAAIGLAAMALNGEAFEITIDDGRYDLTRWVDFAPRNVDLVLRDFIGDADGGNAEGGSYMAYSAIDHVPFFWAWHRYTGGSAYRVWAGSTAAPHFAFANRETYDVLDLWTHPWHERNTLWALRIMQPDGTFPPFDDCTPGSRYFFGVLARPEVTVAPAFRWAWERTGMTTGGSVDASILVLTTFDDSVVAASPDALGIAPNQVLPFSGQAVFRSGWEENAVYSLLVAEHGIAAGNGQTRWGDFVDGVAGHDHADPGQVIIFAYGQPLLIDGGYLGWDNHHRVNDPDDHNIVLVDGEGPEKPQLAVFDITSDAQGRIVPVDMADEGGWVVGADGAAYLVSHDTDNRGAPFAESETTYFVDAPPTTARRKMTLLRDRFTVLHDRVRVFDGEAHTVTIQLHGNGGGTSGGTFSLLSDGALWERAGARLRATVASPLGVTLRTRDSTHDAGGWDERTHTVLDVDVAAPRGTEAEVLTVLVPERDSGGGFDAVVPTDEACEGACLTWQDGALDCRAWTGAEHTALDGAGAPLLTARGGAYCQNDVSLAGIFWEVGSDARALLSARFDFDRGGAPSAWRIAVHSATDEIADLDVPAVAGRAFTGACGISESAGRWRLYAPARSVLKTVDVAPIVNAHLHLIGLAAGTPQTFPLGAEITVSAGLSCTSSTAPMSFDFALTRHPDDSRARVASADPREFWVTFRPDLPGIYSVEVVVTADGSSDAAELTFEVEGEGRLTPERMDEGAPVRGCDCDGVDPALLGAILALWALYARRRRTLPA